MKIIGLTGGIGSGKSTFLKWFESKGIPCFDSDKVGRVLLEKELKEKIIDRFGPSLYSKGSLDRSKLASYVFHDAKALKDLNKIVHPAVQKAFLKFKEANRKSPILIKEAAILFESGGYNDCDLVILVCAPKELRIQRVMERDAVSREAVIARMENQWDDEKKKALADFVIENVETETAEKHLEVLFELLLSKEKH